MLTEGKVVKMASLKLFLECIVGNVSKVEYIMKKFSFFNRKKNSYLWRNAYFHCIFMFCGILKKYGRF